MTQKKELISLKNIETCYEGEKIPAIHDINISVKQGEFITILGPNGAGKTTLLETINGLLPYTTGKGFVLNKEIPKQTTYLRKNIGYVIQNFEIEPLAPFITKDIVMSGRTGKIGLLRFITKKDWDVVWHSLGLVGMIDFAHRPIGKLSGGEFQKILLARALAQEPQILLLDEPFSNLDITSKRQIEILLNRIHEQNQITILMVTHNISSIPSNCTRIIAMNKGYILVDDEKTKIVQSKTLEHMFNSKGVKQ